ncbi:MAG: N-acetylmuramoyl-L-alanine amidase [Gammaproteobacteria bacterium]|nr:N-acetylmuramoyl-L-alanine amidase [Gammaproteobacteria bacterium]
MRQKNRNCQTAAIAILSLMKSSILIAALFCLSIGSVFASKLNGIRTWVSPEYTRIVFDLSKPIESSLFMLKNPYRLVVDLNKTHLSTDMPELDAEQHPLLSAIRSAKRNKRDLRVVLDLNAETDYRSYKLEANAVYGHRLVVELNHRNQAIKSKSNTESVPEQSAGGILAQASDGIEKIIEQVSQAESKRNIIVAIDAGHGGEDPGANGAKGTQEKIVVLKIARKLERLLNQETGIKPVMIRKGDYYISLRKRIALAREAKADLFVSIHADAFHNPRVRGSSVFILSPKGASDEASRWLAERENAADLIGGVSLDDKDNVLASVLLDLSLVGTIDVSSQVASEVLQEMRKVGHMHQRQVQSAGFVVLKSPDIPSMLIETAFISNPKEEKRLNSDRYQQKLAAAIVSGIKRYFHENPPPDTLLASLDDRSYVIRDGDTLSEIANRYRVTVRDLMALNRLGSNVLRVGQRISIPTIQ